MCKILIIDEGKHCLDDLAAKTTDLKIEVHSVSSLNEGQRVSREGGFDIILMRDFVNGHASCKIIQELKNVSSMPEILVYTSGGNPEHAEFALEGGAWDYIIDSEPEKILPDMIRRVVRYRRSKSSSVEHEQRQVRDQLHEHGIVGSSAAIQNCLNMVVRVGQSDASVLITGETGTGKELFATAIHTISGRSAGNLTIIDCAALPSTLVESILFGHAKGSFTGADRSQKGLIKQADGGTLFLDEIGEMPLEIQKKFLRVLQERKYLPVGSSNTETSDFRLIAATNKDLEEMAAKGEFREDLLFRLKTFQLELPPLRIRKIDIAELAYYFRNLYSKRNKLHKKKLSTDYLMTLNQYEWPGNVRELFQAVEYSLADGQYSTILESAHLPINIRLAVTKQKLKRKQEQPHDKQKTELPEKLAAMPTIKEARDKAIREHERRYLERLLALVGDDIKQCCKTTGLSRSRLYDLLKKHDLSRKFTAPRNPEEKR
jgi:two-component system, NtrC family, response regulator